MIESLKTMATSQDYRMQRDTESKIVLIVEDDDEYRFYISESLKNHCTVMQAANPIEALDILNKYIVDLIITDIQMPGMSGVQFIQELKSKSSDIPLVILSGSISNDVRQELDGHNVRFFLEKPVQRRQFQKVIESILEEVVRNTRVQIKT